MRADDSSGIIGDGIRDLLDLHAHLARTAPPPPRKLVDWMIRFQFGTDCDFFEIDPVAYGPALGDQGIVGCGAKLAQIVAALTPGPEEQQAIWRSSLEDPTAWELAHSLGLVDAGLWESLAKRYEFIDPLAVLPIHADQARADLERADAATYRAAARPLAHMRTLVTGTGEADEVDRIIAELRETHRRRPRLHQEFDRARLT